MFYRYIAIDLKGARRQGGVEAASTGEVHHYLKTHGLEPVTVTKSYLAWFFSTIGLYGKKLKNEEIIEIVSFVADFLGSGMDTLMALENLESVVGTKRAKTTVYSIRPQIARGSTLAEAIRRTGRFPDTVYAGLYAGEQAGEIVKALENIEDGLRQEMEFNYALRKALTYPMVVISGVLSVIAVYLVYVLPKVQGITEITGRTPAATAIVFAVMGFARTYWWIFPPLLFSLWIAAKQIKASVGNEKIESLIRSSPLFGHAIASISMTRVFFPLHLLLKAGMSIKDALRIVESSQRSEAMRHALVKVREGVMGGKSVSSSFRCPLFPEVVARMLEVGEKAGLLEHYTKLVGVFYRKKAERELKTLATILEPLMLVVAMGFILLLFFGFIMPIYQSVLNLSEGLK